MHSREVSSPRDKTRNLVLNEIRLQPGRTRSELSNALNISMSTIGHAVSRLLQHELVQEDESESKGRGTGSGRPGAKLFPKYANAFIAAIDFSHSQIKIALANRAGEIVASDVHEIELDSHPQEALDNVGNLVEEMKLRLGIERLDQAVASVPLPISLDGQIFDPLQLSNWGSLRVGEILARKLGVPVLVENDSLICAYGELTLGSGKGLKNFLSIHLADDVGSGLVINGKVYRGAQGFAGDISHIKVPARNDLCMCGERGCVSSAVSLKALRRQILETHPWLTEKDDPFADIDEISQRIIFDAGKALGQILADQARLLNPEAIIIGGTIPQKHPVILEGLDWGFREKYRSSLAAGCKILPSSMNENRILLSCLARAISLIS